MTTLKLRILASLDIIKNKLEACYERISDLDGIISQAKTMHNEITVLIDYLEKIRKFGWILKDSKIE